MMNCQNQLVIQVAIRRRANERRDGGDKTKTFCGSMRRRVCLFPAFEEREKTTLKKRLTKENKVNSLNQRSCYWVAHHLVNKENSVQAFLCFVCHWTTCTGVRFTLLPHFCWDALWPLNHNICLVLWMWVSHSCLPVAFVRMEANIIFRPCNHRLRNSNAISAFVLLLLTDECRTPLRLFVNSYILCSWFSFFLLVFCECLTFHVPRWLTFVPLSIFFDSPVASQKWSPGSRLELRCAHCTHHPVRSEKKEDHRATIAVPSRDEGWERKE